jgi:plastocyanin
MEAIRGHLRTRRAATGAAAMAIAAALLVPAIVAGAAPATGTATASSKAGVDINHFKFHPRTLNVRKGTKVVFSNSAAIAHTATDRGVFDSGHIKPGHSFAVRFEQKGTFPYHCKIHPFMHGKIVVG